MRYLLDTVVWLWSVSTPERIGPRGHKVLSNGAEELYLSAASAWELAIKTKLGQYHLPEPPKEYLTKRLATQGIRPLPITQLHALATYDLPLHHSDPFDRLLIAQAMLEEMVVLTADRSFEKYAVQVVWCGE